jgi:hypothetical protein
MTNNINRISSLKVDIDKKIPIKLILKRIKLINYSLMLRIKYVLITDTYKGYHIRVETKKELGDIDVLIIQLLIGDDYIRSMLNYKRIKRGEKNWNVLFTKKSNKYDELISVEGLTKKYKLR